MLSELIVLLAWHEASIKKAFPQPLLAQWLRKRFKGTTRRAIPLGGEGRSKRLKVAPEASPPDGRRYMPGGLEVETC